MPTYTEPVHGNNDIVSQVTFFAKVELGVLASVDFTLAGSYTNATYDAPAVVNFKEKSKLDTIGYVDFIVPTPAYTDFPATVDFVYYTGTYSFSAAVDFKNYASLLASTTFFQKEESSTPGHVTIYQIHDFPASVYLFDRGNFSFPAYAILGNLNYNLNANVTFNQSSHKDFSSNIQIQQVTVQKADNNFSDYDDFKASMFINGLGIYSMHAFANFRVPPFDYDLPAQTIFTQKSQRDFQSTIKIHNKSLGGGHIPISISDSNDSLSVSESTNIESTIVPLSFIPNTSETIGNVITDATGYFEILNLNPGTYTIVPSYPGITFNPPAYNIKIINSNVTLIFNGSGNLVNEIETTSTLPQNTTPGTCYIDQTSGDAGTFSIEGYIKLEASGDAGYTEVVTVITDEPQATSYRDTLGF